MRDYNKRYRNKPPPPPGHADEAPYMRMGQCLTATRIMPLIAEIRRRKGRELWYRRCAKYDSTSVMASRLRAVLGDAFHVRRSGYDIFVRCRLVGEPTFSGDEIGDPKSQWMTVNQAAAYAKIHPQDLRRGYLDTGKLRRFQYGQRVAVYKPDVYKLFRYDKPVYGVVVHEGKAAPKVETL